MEKDIISAFFSHDNKRYVVYDRKLTIYIYNSLTYLEDIML
jgi:hypothetical protein